MDMFSLSIRKRMRPSGIRPQPVALLQPVSVLEYALTRELQEDLKSSLPAIEEIEDDGVPFEERPV